MAAGTGWQPRPPAAAAEPGAASVRGGTDTRPAAQSRAGAAEGEAALPRWGVHRRPTGSPGLGSAGLERTSKPAEEVFWKINQSN